MEGPAAYAEEEAARRGCGRSEKPASNELGEVVVDSYAVHATCIEDAVSPSCFLVIGDIARRAVVRSGDLLGREQMPGL
jgi:hypothetical protein